MLRQRTPMRQVSEKRAAKLALARVRPPRIMPTRSSIPLTSVVSMGPFTGEVVAVPKVKPWRSRTLLDMARGERCNLMAVHNCRGLDGSTTVACHRNEGKGLSQKQSDEWTVHGCAPCHEWLDRSGAPRAKKRRAFDAAHALRQVPFWRLVAVDPARTHAQREAAMEALRRLGAFPLPGATWFDQPEAE